MSGQEAQQAPAPQAPRRSVAHDPPRAGAHHSGIEEFGFVGEVSGQMKGLKIHQVFCLIDLVGG